MWHKAINVVMAVVLAVMLVPLFLPATPVAASPDPPLYQAYSSASSSGDVTSIEVPMPSGTVENDLLVALFTKDATTGTLSSPGDWTDVCELSTGASRFMVAYKLAGSGESGPYTFSSDDSDQMACGIARITGADTTTPINAQSSTNTGNTNAPQCLEAITDADDCLVLRCMGADDDDYSSGNNYPSGHTGRFTVQATGSYGETHCALATNSQASAGGTDTADFAMTAAEQWGTITLAITPLAGAYTEQLHFRWRDDTTDLNSSGGWHAAEDSNDIGMLDKNTTIRLRMEVANTGTGAESEARTYELQYEHDSTWTGVGDASDAFDMVGTTHIDPDGESATPGLLANSEGYTFVTGEGRDTADTTGSIGALSASYYTELEYSFKATDSASAGVSYRFRLYDTTAGAALDSYTVWPEVTIYQVPIVDQTHYRWRNDDGEEAGSWTVDGQEYTTRRMLTIDDSLIDTDLTDFPVRVSLASFPGIDLAEFNSDGYDIRFTKFDETTLLKYERESFNQTADTGEVWVKIPNVRSSASDDNRFFIYYRTTDTTDGEDATNVWDTNYQAVYHLNTATQSTVTTDCEYFSDTFSRAIVRTDDDNKTIHVFYAKDPGDSMSLWWRTSTDDGATWSAETQIGTSNGRASLATATVDPNNGKDIHMSYCCYSGATFDHHYMYYRKLSWNGSGWDIGSEAEVHNESGYETADSSIVVDSGGVVHLVFLWSDGGTSNRLYYENNSAGNWNASPTQLASDTSWIIGVIQLDSDRNLHVVSSYNNLIQWRKATYSAGPSWSWAASWTSISGGTFTDAWSHVNTCMDASDRLHVAWGGYATSYRPLKYARKNANDTWETTIILDSGNNHTYTEITAYGDRVYVTAAYNSGTGQIVFYKSTDAGANFGSRSAITDTSYNLRFHSRISRYGVRPVFEGVWRQGSGSPWNVKYTLIDELDSTANDNDGSCVGALDPNATGQIDSGDDFDGTDDYIDIGTGPTSVQTVSFWVYPQTTTECLVNLTGTSVCISANAGTVTAIGFTGTPTIYVDGESSSTIVAGEWQHVAVTTDTAENASNLDIGRIADANYLEGMMDEVRLSQTARTAAWIKADCFSGDNSLLTYGSEETGTGTAATWKEDEDTPATGQARFENLRVRFSIKDTGGTASNYNYRLQVSDNQTSGYTDVPLFSTPGTSVACMATSTNFADQDATTRQLSWPGSLSWTAGKMVEDTSNQTDAITLNKNYFTEVEFNFQFTSVAQGSTTYYFRLVNSTTDLDSYTQVAQITMGALPTWESYSDATYSIQCDTFDEYPAKHWVYMHGEGFTPSATYKVIYWDPLGTKRVVDSSVQAGSSGNLSSSHAFELGDEPGDWQCVTYYPATYDPTSYSTTDSNISGDDVSYPPTTGGSAFNMEAAAIPEFPTVISAIAAMGLCFGIYWWMRRRRVYNRVR